ncbi:transcriptional antiterminator, BglG family [Paenibacillus algorifonticola]|uniref:Transcriptional antiterminator, BglG family n=1 Tax=Paenibacillus algorifonticola TaxID=684063 RepID=A0A1I2ITX7_9BACL|nr:PRD domain-containing protein [Paenibacillus algorifonticola]SFF45078.1 transcriptional antiterminator, BglG family [Paenibacillus algorifonticola]
MSGLQIDKALNNNVIIAQHSEHGEVVVIGKGIGFNRKAGDIISLLAVEKMFILKNQEEQEQYKLLLPQVDEELIEIINELLLHITEHKNVSLNEHIHIALTDHISFALKRKKQGIVIQNPFLYETRELYPDEYRIGEYAVRMIEKKLGVDLGVDEIGFIALHIYSAVSNQNIMQVKKQSQLINELVGIVSNQLNFPFEVGSLDYSRLITHLRFALERIIRGEKLQELKKMDLLLKIEYPEMYLLAWKLTKVMENRLRLPVYHAELGYLTIHLQRLNQKKEEKWE